MTELSLTAEDLLAGAAATYQVVVPPEIIRPGSRDAEENGKKVTVVLRPLNIGSFQLILKAAREDPGLIPILMIKESVIEPTLSLAQVRQMHLGMVDFLVGNIRRISGMAEKKNP